MQAVLGPLSLSLSVERSYFTVYSTCVLSLSHALFNPLLIGDPNCLVSATVDWLSSSPPVHLSVNSCAADIMVENQANPCKTHNSMQPRYSRNIKESRSDLLPGKNQINVVHVFLSPPVCCGQLWV